MSIKKLTKAHKTHSWLWWPTMIITVIFSVFLLAVSFGAFDSYEIPMQHFSAPFFLLVLLSTIVMSYRRAKRRRGQHFVGPFICSIFFGVITQFLFFLAAPLMPWDGDMQIYDLIKMTFFFVTPSLITFSLIRILIKNKDIAEDNSWFNWHYYLRWMNMMANAMTTVSFFELFFTNAKGQSFLGIRGIVWAFYSLVAGRIGEILESKHTQKELIAAKKFDILEDTSD